MEAVHWGGNYVSEHTLLQGTEFPGAYRVYTDGGQSYLSIKSAVQNLTPASGYDAPVDRSGSFSGGWMASQGPAPGVPGGESGNGGGLDNRVVYDGGAKDRISLSLPVAGGAPAMRGMIVFEKSGFLNGLDQQTVGFDSSSMLSFSGIMDGYRPVGRWLVMDGNTWYISQATIIQAAYNTVETHTLTDPNSVLWAAFIPTENDSLGAFFYNEAPTTGYEAHTFSDVRGGGIFFDSYGALAGDGGFSRFVLEDYSMTLSVVPEPSSITFLIAASCALLGLAWRKRSLRIR